MPISWLSSLYVLPLLIYQFQSGTIEWGIGGLHLFGGNRARISVLRYSGDAGVRRTLPFHDLESRQIGLDGVYRVDSMDVAESARHVKQLLQLFYVDHARPYSRHPGVLLQSDDHAHVNDACRQVRNAVSARGHVLEQYDTDRCLDRDLTDPRLNPHVLVRDHHALVHIHLVLRGAVVENIAMVSKRGGWRGVGGIDGGPSRFLEACVLPTSAASCGGVVEHEHLEDAVEGVAGGEVDVEFGLAWAPDTSVVAVPNPVAHSHVHPSSDHQMMQVQAPLGQAYRPEHPFFQGSSPFDQEPSLGELPYQPRRRLPWAVGW